MVVMWYCCLSLGGRAAGPTTAVMVAPLIMVPKLSMTSSIDLLKFPTPWIPFYGAPAAIRKPATSNGQDHRPKSVVILCVAQFTMVMLKEISWHYSDVCAGDSPAIMAILPCRSIK